MHRRKNFIHRLKIPSLTEVRINELEACYPKSIILVTTIYWIDKLREMLDFIPPELVIESVCNATLNRDVVLETITNVANFLDSCGYRSGLDIEANDIVNRIIGTDRLVEATEMTTNLLGKELLNVAPNFEDYILLDWMDLSGEPDLALKVYTR